MIFFFPDGIRLPDFEHFERQQGLPVGIPVPFLSPRF
jgi:hypothetical protein